MKPIKYMQFIWLLSMIPTLYASDEALVKQREEIMREELANKATSTGVKNNIASYAIQCCNWQLATDALAQGADPCYIAEKVPSNVTLFTQAMKECGYKYRLEKLAHYPQCNASCIKALHDHGIDIDTSSGEHGSTPLHSAASRGDIPKIEQLVTYGARVLNQDGEGKTPADYAMSKIRTDLNWSLYKEHQQALTQILIALQKGTSVNLLNPCQYPFYQQYRKMVIDHIDPSKPQRRRVAVYNRRGNDYDKSLYLAYARLVDYLKQAEKEHCAQS